MKALSRFRSWLRSMVHRSRMERDLDAELSFHIERYTEDLVRSGVAPAEASRRARVEFGAVEARKEEMREALGLRLVDELHGDLRYAFRQLRQSPAFTAVAVLSLVLGIGANTAIFSLMEAALWKSIPVRNPEELRLLSWESGANRVMNGINGNMSRTATGGSTSTSFSYPVFLALQRQNQAFESLFTFKPVGRITAVIDGRAELLFGMLVSGNFYHSVGVVPAAGRPILASDDAPDAEKVAVISNGLWERRFGRDPSVLGKAVEINGAAVTIVGINPRDFTGVEPGRNPDLFFPMGMQSVAWPRTDSSALTNPDMWWVIVIGRLKRDVADAEAQAALAVVFDQAVRASLPDRGDRDQPRLQIASGARGLDDLDGYRNPLLILLSLGGVVLLIACANIANLLLARAASRRREVSLRLAIGAGRWRITRQLLTEGLALASVGGGAGILLGYWMRDAVPGLLATSWRPGPFQAEFDGRVLGVSIGITLATGILFSLAPAWQSARVEINSALKNAGRAAFGLPRWSRGKPLVVFQVCLSILLLVGAGLFIRTLSNLMTVNLGFQPERILLFGIAPPRATYPDQRRLVLFDQLHQRIAVIPGVQQATLSAEPLIARGSSQTRIGLDPSVPMVPTPQPTPGVRQAWVNDVGHDFFETMGIPILNGRSFGPPDSATSERVAVVSQQFAREFYPDENPIGKAFRNGNRVLRIIGVSGDTRYDRSRRPFPPTFYRLYLQEPPTAIGAMTFEVKTTLSQLAAVSAIREAVRSIDRELPVFDVRTQTEQISDTNSQERLFAVLTVAFGVLALVIASIGIYGIMANGVARRTNEIGIRIALGAERTRVLWMVLREAALLATVGAAIGLGLAIGLTRYVESMLFGVPPIDPLTMSAAVGVMLGVALFAGWIPARRASRLDPMVALRHE